MISKPPGEKGGGKSPGTALGLSGSEFLEHGNQEFLYLDFPSGYSEAAILVQGPGPTFGNHLNSN